VLQADDEVDVVFPAPPEAPLEQVAERVQLQLGECAGVALVSPLGPDGLLQAPGLRIAMLSRVVVKLIFSQRIPNLPDPRPEVIVQRVAGIYAREISENILASVPNQGQFRALLQFVRRWARLRGVYGQGSFMGFLGGTAWAICCARACQTNSHLELPQLVGRFFRAVSRWDWKQPVSLSAPASPTAAAQSGPPPPAYDALAAPGDAASGGGGGKVLTLVLLPVGQNMSATPFATDTILKITQKELRRGYKMTQQVELGRVPWNDMYAKARFFQRHRHYLEFDFMARSPEILEPWLAWGRQHMQNLVKLFEERSASMATLRPWPEEVEFKDAEWPCARAVFVGLHLERSGGAGLDGAARRSFDLREPIVKLLEAVSGWSQAEANHGQFELLIRHVRLAELEQWLELQREGRVRPGSEKLGPLQLPAPGELEGEASGELGAEADDGQFRHASL